MLEQIERFVSDSLNVNYKWESIGLLGGEPTLYPALQDAIALLQRYVAQNPSCNLFLVSNGYGKAVTRTLDKISASVKIERRLKTNDEDWFNNIDLAPVDIGEDYRSCSITQDCGLGLTRRGFFPCGPGAAVARVLDIKIGADSLSEITESNMIEGLKETCKYCGHSLQIQAKDNRCVSSFWQHAYEVYRDAHAPAP